MHTFGLCIGVVCVTSVLGVIGQISDLRSPCRRRTGVVCTLAATLCVDILVLVLATQGLGTDVGREGDHRLSCVLATTLGRNDDHTVRSTDTIKCGCSLTLQDVDALNVLGVDINTTVGEVGTCYRVTCREVRC